MYDKKLVSAGNPKGINPAKIPAVIVIGLTLSALMGILHSAGKRLICNDVVCRDGPKGAEVLRRLCANTGGIPTVFTSHKARTQFGDGANQPMVILVGENELWFQKALHTAGFDSVVMYWSASEFDFVGEKAVELLNSEAGVPTLYLSTDDYAFFGATPEVVNGSDKFAQALAEVMHTGPTVSDVADQPLTEAIDRLRW